MKYMFELQSLSGLQNAARSFIKLTDRILQLGQLSQHLKSHRPPGRCDCRVLLGDVAVRPNKKGSNPSERGLKHTLKTVQNFGQLLLFLNEEQDGLLEL